MRVSECESHTHTTHPDTDTPRQTHTQRVEERRSTHTTTQCVCGGERCGWWGVEGEVVEACGRGWGGGGVVGGCGGVGIL